MKSLLRKIFLRKHSITIVNPLAPQVDVVAGEIWEYKYNEHDEDPFPKTPTSVDIRVKILEVRDGWVRYCWMHPMMCQDNRSKISVFVQLHRKL